MHFSGYPFSFNFLCFNNFKTKFLFFLRRLNHFIHLTDIIIQIMKYDRLFLTELIGLVNRITYLYNSSFYFIIMLTNYFFFLFCYCMLFFLFFGLLYLFL